MHSGGTRSPKLGGARRGGRPKIRIGPAPFAVPPRHDRDRPPTPAVGQDWRAVLQKISMTIKQRRFPDG
jgi:hypothetical protein